MKNSNNITFELAFIFLFVSFIILFHFFYKLYFTKDIAENVLSVSSNCDESISEENLAYIKNLYYFLKKHKSECKICDDKHICEEANNMLQCLSKDFKK